MKDTSIPVARLHELFAYDPETGELKWRSGQRAGREAGWSMKHGYRVVGFDGVRSLVHRIGFAMTEGRWPSEQIDHIDGDGSNNRRANLRESSQRQNLCNTAVRSDNTSGVKGVYWDRRRRKWHAQISHHGHRIALGRFTDLEAAKAAYAAATEKYHGEFACLDRAA